MVDDETLDKILYLSRLAVEGDERAQLARQMGTIIDYFAILSKYDTSSVAADLGAAVPGEALRADEAREGLRPHEVKSFAVQFLDGYFSVPRILEEET